MDKSELWRWGRRFSGLPLVLLMVVMLAAVVGSEFGFISKDQSVVLASYVMRSFPLAVGLVMAMAQDASISGKGGKCLVRVSAESDPIKFWIFSGGLMLLGLLLLLLRAVGP